jgi:hypothetical protein
MHFQSKSMCSDPSMYALLCELPPTLQVRCWINQSITDSWDNVIIVHAENHSTKYWYDWMWNVIRKRKFELYRRRRSSVNFPWASYLMFLHACHVYFHVHALFFVTHRTKSSKIVWFRSCSHFYVLSCVFFIEHICYLHEMIIEDTLLTCFHEKREKQCG